MPERDAQRSIFLSFVNGMSYDSSMTSWLDLIRWSNRSDTDRDIVYDIENNGTISYVNDTTWHIDGMSIRMYHPQDLFNIIPGEYTISGDVSLADDEIYHVTITEAEYHNPEALSDEYANVDYLDMLPTQNGDGSIVYNIHKEMVE